jgi:glycosyltransferase involved in cell wall biosynthesis
MAVSFLFVTEDKYPPYRSDVAVLFGEELASRGYKIDLLLQAEDPTDKPRQTQWGGGTAWIAKMDAGTSTISKVKKNLYSIWNDLKMFKLASAGRYDFIQVKDKFVSALLAILVSKIYRLKFVYWLSFPFPEAMLYRVSEGISRHPLLDYVRGHLFRLLLYKVIMRSAAHVFVQSDQMKKDVAAMGIPRDKLTPVPMGVPLRKMPNPADEQCDEISVREKSVIYLGALERVRRIDFLIRVFRQVLQTVPGAKLYLVGASSDPADVEELRDLAEELGIGKAVIFTGFLPMSEAWRQVTRAAVAVSPFYPTPILRSTSPTKLIEYMALGKPVVANDHPEQRTVIEVSGGGICVPYDEAAFAEAIVELLSDSERARGMGLRGRRFVEEYRSYVVLADRVEHCYRDLCMPDFQVS